MILLDTNILVYATDSRASQHEASHSVLRAALNGRVPGVLVPQVLVEFLAVVTNPRRVHRPVAAVQAWRQAAALRSGLPVLELRPTALDLLGELMGLRPALGPGLFDLFLAAQMRSHRVPSICTYNRADFLGLPEIEPLAPNNVLDRYRLPQA